MSNAAELLELLPDGIVLHDGDRIVAANAATLRLAGAERREQVVGQPVSVLFEYPHLKLVERQLITGRDGRDAAGFVRQRLYGVDGSVQDVDVHAQLVLHGERPAVLLVLHDAREQVDAERRAEERREAARVVQRRQVSRQIAGGVAHTLNNRLQIILGFANLLAEEPLTPTQQRDVEQIMHAAMEGAAITRQLLHFAGAASWSPQLVGLDVLTPRLAGEWEESNPRRASPLRVVIETVPDVRVDPAHVRYVLSYLLANARWATRESGDITLTVQSVALPHSRLASEGEYMPSGRYVTMTVQDTGDGISADAQYRMFEPFFTTAQLGGGYGLGLSAAQGLMRQAGGYLTYASALGEGSSFTLWFPEHDAASMEGPSSGAVRVPDRAMILVIDADPVTRATTVCCLERVGYRVLQASTPLEAEEAVGHLDCPALFVATETTDRRSGGGLASLRARCPTVPVLVLNTDTSHEAARPGEGSAADGPTTAHLSSPYSEYVLVSRVRTLLGDAT
jgi:PAS domain S-box-containing protein